MDKSKEIERIVFTKSGLKKLSSILHLHKKRYKSVSVIETKP